MHSNKTYILFVVFFFHMKTSRQNCRPVCLVTERAQASDTSGLQKCFDDDGIQTFRILNKNILYPDSVSVFD